MPSRFGPQHPRRGAASLLLAWAAFCATLGTALGGVACANRPPARPVAAVASAVAPTESTMRGTGATSTGSAAGDTARPSPTASATPILPPSFSIEVDPPFVARGETLLVRVDGASAGTVRVGGVRLPLLPSAASSAGSEGAWAVLGVGLYADLGAAGLTVAGSDARGNALGEVTATYTIVDPNRPADDLEVTEVQAALLTPEAAALETRLRAEQFAAFDATPRWRTAFRHPLLAREVTTLFGSGRSINGGPVGDFHSGEDLAADEGTPVTAAAPGRVAWAGAMPIRGASVLIDHGGGVLTGYHHLADTTVVAGQQVEAGALVGHVGSTGFSTGPHLHWEITIYGVNVDPETWTTRLFGR